MFPSLQNVKTLHFDRQSSKIAPKTREVLREGQNV